MAAQDRDQARLRRKLTAAHRLKMARLAAERFRCPDLREIEAAAKATVTDQLYRDATAIPASEIEVLRKHGFTRTFEGFDLPNEIGYREDGKRSFKLPNGVKIERKGGQTKIVVGPNAEDRYDLPSFGRWCDALAATPERSKDYKYAADGRRVTMPKPVDLPARRGSADFGYMRADEDTKGRITIDNANDDWITDEARRAVVAYYLAADARILAERKLIVSAIAVIASCTTYGQALDFWPEVEELEVAMFGVPALPPAFALVTLTDEDKKALCANMASRGVAGAACDRIAA